MPNPENNLFGEPISIYTDAEALEDGLLVAITGHGAVNRVTQAVFAAFASRTGDAEAEDFDITRLITAIRQMLALTPDGGGWRTAEIDGKTLWLIPNEVSGLTLMFPEDY